MEGLLLQSRLLQGRLPITSGICGDSASLPRIRSLQRLEDLFHSPVGIFSGSFLLTMFLFLDPLPAALRRGTSSPRSWSILKSAFRWGNQERARLTPFKLIDPCDSSSLSCHSLPPDHPLQSQGYSRQKEREGKSKLLPPGRL